VQGPGQALLRGTVPGPSMPRCPQQLAQLQPILQLPPSLFLPPPCKPSFLSWGVWSGRGGCAGLGAAVRGKARARGAGWLCPPERCCQAKSVAAWEVLCGSQISSPVVLMTASSGICLGGRPRARGWGLVGGEALAGGTLGRGMLPAALCAPLQRLVPGTGQSLGLQLAPVAGGCLSGPSFWLFSPVTLRLLV